MSDEIIKFMRKRDYRLIRELGQGACGKTVLLHDDIIDEDFVCKKYSPYSEERRQELFANFIRETKILHRVNHENVVRVFNYYLYPENWTGYILMEYIDGSDIDDFLAKKPEMINEVFLQAIYGFNHLEMNGILHRDIRPQNLLVRADGTLKLIDFGFGKQINARKDFDKSVTLNWWCEPPEEFSFSVYDFGTEVYFVGKLFERIIQENRLDQFKYATLLKSMCQHSPGGRVSSFSEVHRHLQSDRFFEIGFSEDEATCYRNFADEVEGKITKIGSGSKYQEDVDKVIVSLENAYRNCLLEETVPDSGVVIECFVHGAYYFRKKGLPVAVVRQFLQILKSASPEKRRIIISNLYNRLDAITRYSEELDQDVPF